MIKANELRIGNWVNSFWPMSFNGTPIKVDLDILAIIAHNSEGIEPIPLTPEILKKAGFQQTGVSWASIRIGVNLLHYSIDHHKFTIGYGMADEISIGIELYLHQLQNLFFALSGEELIVTL